MANNTKILILTIYGGNGHLQAAKAKALEMKRKDPSCHVVERNLLIYLIGKKLSNLFTQKWNQAQIEGKYDVNIAISNLLCIANCLLFLPTFFYICYLLLKHKIDLIIDTQVVGTCASLKALRCISKLKNKKISYQKVITELPTNKVVHYFHHIKKLSKNDRRHFSLLTTHPLLKVGETTEAFWKTNCNLTENEVHYSDLPLLPAFTSPKKNTELTIQTHGIEETRLTKEIIQRGDATVVFRKTGADIKLDSTSKISTLMLGSQPSENAIIKYIGHFIRIMHEKNQLNQKHILFVFCSPTMQQHIRLLKKIHRLVTSILFYPTHLTIVPLGAQEDQVVASLFHQSDATFTRSGGLTSMELLAVAKGQIWIHSEYKKTAREELLLEAMPIWERGNATYLKEKKGAKMVSPDIFEAVCSDYFS